MQRQPLLHGDPGSTGFPAGLGDKGEDGRWLPLVLKPTIPTLLCTFMVLGGVGLEVSASARL
jgi:hypothetical protein